MAYSGKCTTAVLHPDNPGLIVNPDEEIVIEDEAQFNSLVEIGAVAPLDKAEVAPSKPKTAKAATV